MTLQLRPLQEQAIAKVQQAFREGYKNVLLQAPCGFGKTELSTAMLIKTRDNMKRGAFVCDRLSLIEQTGERFDKYGLKYGVMQAQHEKTDKRERIQLCSIQTIGKKKWPETDLIMADECHVLPKALTDRISKRDCYTVGLSATPFTKGLGQHFDVVINAATTNELIEAGLLVPYRVFAVAEPDLADVKVVAGEWDEKQLESKVLPVVGDCVAEYQKLGEGKKFICFAVSILHAAELKRQFAEAGIVTELYTYKESAEEKIEYVNEFRKPDSYIRGLISIESLTRGFDVSDIEVLILARPLRNAIAVHIQMMGRVLRTSVSTGKTIATILDHSGNCARFWNQVADFFENGISVLDDGKKKSKEEIEKAKPKDKEAAKCPKCKMIHEAKICPGCGFEYVRASGVLHVAGELTEIKGGKSFSMEFKQNFYSELLTYAQSKGYADGWVANQYRSKFNVWPNSMKRELRPLSVETANYIRSRQIAYAKAKKAAT